MLRSPVFALRDFRNLWLGQAISQLGDAFYYATFMFMVKKLTGSNAMVGFVGAVETLPFLLVSPYAGVIADRIDRRKIMLLSDLISGLALVLFASFFLFGTEPPIWMIFATAFSLSTVRAFFLPSKSAAIPNVVPKELLLKANSLSMATQNLMPLLGLALTAAVLAPLYDKLPMYFYMGAALANSVSFFLSAVFIYRLPALEPNRQTVDDEGRPLQKTGPLSDFFSGLRYVRSRHVLVVLFMLQFGFTMMISPFFPAYIAVNDEWFGGKPASIMWFEFSFFLGMIVASAAVGKLNVTRPGLGFIFALFTVAVGVALMAFSPFFYLFCLWNLLCGLGVPFGQIPVATYLQATVPDAFRGRVNSTLTMLSIGAQPLGLALGGILVDKVGVSKMFLGMGICMGIVALLGLLDRPFRESRMPSLEPKPAPPSDEGEALAATA
jgi:MFS transporter, DHA3 family, macrolide efflux protein